MPVTIEYTTLNGLKKAARNPKEHATQQIRDSIARFGFNEPLVINEKTGRLVSGHGRLEALMQLRDSGAKLPKNVTQAEEDWAVPVVRGVSFKNEGEANAYLLAVNKLVERGGWNREALSQLVQEMMAQDVSMLGVGFGDDEIQKLMALPVNELAGEVTEREGLTNGGVGEVTSKNAIVKMVPLYMDETQHARFTEKVKQLSKEWGLDNVTAVVLRVIESL